MKPFPETAGLRATLNRFFSTPEKTHEPNPAINALEDEDNKASKEVDDR